MTEYKVVWEIELQADSLKDAAEEARKIQLDPTSIAKVFQVSKQEKFGKHTIIHERGIIDLETPLATLSNILKCPECGYRRLATRPNPLLSPGNTQCVCLRCGNLFYVGIP